MENIDAKISSSEELVGIDLVQKFLIDQGLLFIDIQIQI